jgi:CHAD domain-containing protein
VNGKASESYPGTLTLRLLALLEKISQRARKEDVHHLRTTVRRLEEHLDNPPAKIAKSLKKLRKKAGKVRDIDVHLDLLRPALPVDGFKSATPARSVVRSQEKLRSILENKRDSQSTRLQNLVEEFTPLLESRLPMLIEQRRRSKLSMEDARQQAHRARQRFLQWTRQIPEDEDRLHRLRINTKRLRYSLEPLEFCPDAATVAEKFKQVQDAIGDWHDWVTLQQLAQRRLNSPGAAPVIKALEARAGREYRRARRSAENARSWMQQSRQPQTAGPKLVRKAG